MANERRSTPISELPQPEPIAIRTARGRFGALVDRVAEGQPVLICRRSTPLAVLFPAGQYEELVETVRRDQSLAAVLRARGVEVGPWTTAGVLEAVVRVLEGGRT